MVQIRSFFAMIDTAIYGFISAIWNVISILANIDLFSEEAINGFTTRIYTILGIFMLFKVSFSFISYLVNPDKFMDNKTGFSKMIVNIIVVFIMLIGVPWAFQLLRTAQSAILNDEIISHFILGNTGSNVETGYGTEENTRQYAFKYDNSCESYMYTSNKGTFFSIMLMRPFYQYDSSFTEGMSEEEATAKKQEGVLCTLVENKKGATVATLLKPTVLFATQNQDGSLTGLLLAITSYLTGIAQSTGTGVPEAVASGGLNFASAYISYQVSYSFFLSTIVGILAAGLLISFALDIAVRSIKMGFLQIMAPIPIISYIDPDSSKHKFFNNWLKDVGKTWASLFIRIATLDIIIYILEILEVSNIFKKMPWALWVWIGLFYLLGALIFAKKLPSWLESLTGIKFDGGFEINPLKKVKNEALGGRQVANGMMGVAGAGVGLAGSAISHGIAYASNRKKFNTENTKLNNMKNDARASRIENNQKWRGLLDERRNLVQQKQRKSNLKNEMSSISGRIDALTASGRGDSALADNLRKQYNSKAGEFNSIRDISDSEIQSKTAAINDARRTAMASKRADQEKIAEQQTKVDKINNEKIYKNPVASAAGEIARGAYRGARNAYNADTLNVGKIVSAGLKGTDEAALKRIYREDFSIQDELHDKITSFAHVKNDSGTSSEIAKELKANMDRLDNLTSALNTLESRLGNLPNSYSGAKLSEINNLVIQREKILERYTDAADYLRKNQGSALSKADLDVVFDTVNELVSETKERKQLTKRNKELDDMLKQQNKKE